MLKMLQSELLSGECRISMVPVRRLDDLQTEFENLKNGSIDESTHTFIKGYYNFKLPDTQWTVQSIIIAATPSPLTIVYFNRGGKKIPVFIPPTYADYIERPARVESQLKVLLGQHGYQITRVHDLPAKILAAHSGLCEYGRNNICYISDLGSFILLTVFYTDLPCTEDPWGEIRRMDCCNTCTACMSECPTGAILHDRTIIKARQCLTFLNECTDTDTFPGWLNPEAHHCLIGCMRCQLACPVNKGKADHPVAIDEFTEEETGLLLEKRPLDSLPAGLVERLKKNNMAWYYPLISRNLKALFDKND